MLKPLNPVNVYGRLYLGMHEPRLGTISFADAHTIVCHNHMSTCYRPTLLNLKVTCRAGAGAAAHGCLVVSGGHRRDRHQHTEFWAGALSRRVPCTALLRQHHACITGRMYYKVILGRCGSPCVCHAGHQCADTMHASLAGLGVNSCNMHLQVIQLNRRCCACARHSRRSRTTSSGSSWYPSSLQRCAD